MNGAAAQKLLEKMRSSASGWGQKDFEHLLLGYGFYCTGTKHSIYIHPQYPDLRLSVPRHNTLKEWVARDAVKLIDKLNERLSTQGENNGTKTKNT